MKQAILIMSHNHDSHVPYVTKHLADEKVIVMNPSDIFDGDTIDFTFSDGVSNILYKDEPLGPIKSIWVRRPVPTSERDDLPLKDTFKPYAQNAVAVHAQMLAAAFPDAFWVSHPENIGKADYKILQLRVANKLGMNIPETLFASSPKQAQNFLAKHKICIAKSQATILPLNHIAFTRILHNDDDIDFSKLNYDPFTFQQYIEPDFELRVTVVGDKVFTAKVGGEEIDGVQSVHRDWRYSHVNDTFKAEVYKLSDGIQHQCVQLVKELELKFGAIDLIVDKKGKVWFLEINSNGQWAFVESETGQPIGKALADMLIAG
jgi:glutathione synthase/RimK-type ligase-like ATP-grasp enzyme